MSAETEVQDLIATYIERWNARDYDGMADMFTEPVTYVVPGGTTSVPNRAALIDKLKAQFADMESKGFDHTVLDGVDTRQCNDTTVIADLKGVARLKADGTPIEVIDAVYICVKQDAGWRMSIAMMCWKDWKAA